jgi:hypothetical protein
VFLDFLIEGAAGDPQAFGCSLDPTALFLEYALDVTLLEFQKGQTGIKERRANV